MGEVYSAKCPYVVSVVCGMYVRLVVGAPVSNSSNPSVHSPGAIFRCNIQDQHKRCHQMDAGLSLPLLNVLCVKLFRYSL